MIDGKLIESCQRALLGYRPSADALKAIDGLNLVLLVGPSSSGRNTVIRELVKTGEFHFIISDTTRSPRVNDGILEVDGSDYWFRSLEEVLADIRSGKYLEAAVIHKRQVSGISVRELSKAHADNKIAIADVEVVGAANIIKAKPDTSVMFITPPSFPVWIERLHHRGVLPEDEVRSRLESALEEFAAALAYDYYHFVVNDEMTATVAKVYELSRYQRFDQAEQIRGKAIVEKLIIDTRSYLSRK